MKALEVCSMILFFSFRITRKQKEALLSLYPDIKSFVEKTIQNTTDKIIIGRDLFVDDEDLEAYHDRRVLNGSGPGRKRIVTQATKDKIKKSLKKYYAQFEGQEFHLFPETKRLIGLAHKGKIVSQATRDKMSKANKGKIRTEEQRQNISKAKTGQKYKKHVKIKSN